MSQSATLVERFKRTIRYRIWVILLFSIVGVAGGLTSNALTGAAPDVTALAIHFFGMAILVTVFFMITNSYNQDSQNGDGGKSQK